MNKEINLSIVGCGAAAVSFLRNFIESSTAHSRIKIMMFDASESFGVGLAYQSDLSNLMINRPVQTMSAHDLHLDEFYHWFKSQRAMNDKALLEFSNHYDINEDQSYVPRKLFGLYLQDMLRQTIAEASRKGIEVALFKQEIVKIKSIKPYVLQSASGDVFIADYVVLCTGNNLPKDIYNLNNTPQYINNPYPMQTNLAKVNPACRVGIIGNSLTAIDVAISLKALGHRGPIVMLSRSQCYPRVRAKAKRYPLKFLNSAGIDAMIKHKTCLTLRDILRLFRQELLAVDYDWRLLFKDQKVGDDFVTVMENEIQSSHRERPWQSVLSATNQVIERCWHYLKVESKALFLAKYNRVWLNNRSPIPSQNAQILVEMAKDGQLSLQSALQNVNYCSDQEQYMVSFNDETLQGLDCMINATGPAKYLQPDNPLLYDLVKMGWARESHFGGLDVDFDSSSLIGTDGKQNPSFRLIGHNTSGVHYYTSSLEMIAKRSRSVALSLVNVISQAEMRAQTRVLADGADQVRVGHYPAQLATLEHRLNSGAISTNWSDNPLHQSTN